MKRCPKCETEKCLSEFSKNATRPDGLSAYCRTCYAARTAVYRAEQRAFLHAYKMKAGCTDCGYRGHPEALEFDHVRGRKSFEIGKGRAQARKTVLAEIAKCEVVCANCHRVRTARRRDEKKFSETVDTR